jgi:DNA-binding NarL/FixJ family response regulator
VPPGTSPLAAARSLRPDVLVLALEGSAGQQLPMLVRLGELSRVIALCGGRDTMLEALAARRTIARVLVHGEFTRDDFVGCVAAVAGSPLAGQTPRLDSSAIPRGRASIPRAGSITPLGSAASQLSAREADVMQCIAKGMRNTEIAVALTVTQKTVKNYINRIFTKLGVETRTQALLIWLEAAA